MLWRCSLRCLSTTIKASAANKTVMKSKSAYAVVVGRRPGLYTSWEQCLAQVKGFPANHYKGFKSEEEAARYLAQHGVQVQGGINAVEGAAVAAAARGGGAGAADAAAAAVAPPAAGTVARGRKRRAPSTAASHQQAAPPAAAAETGLPSATNRVFRLEFDGGSKGNPGPAGFGAVLYDDATNTEVVRLCQYMGHHTNNQAEYAGLIAGLQAALELGCQRIKVQGDSTLIIKQVLGQWQVKNEGLRPYHAAASSLRHRFASFEARQVLRQYNQAADALCNQAIDSYRSGASHQLWRLEEAVAAHAAAAAAAAGDGLDGGGFGDDVQGGAAYGTTAGEAAAAAAAAATVAAGGGGGEGLAAAAAAAAGEDGGGSSRAEEPAKRARRAA